MINSPSLTSKARVRFRGQISLRSHNDDKSTPVDRSMPTTTFDHRSRSAKNLRSDKGKRGHCRHASRLRLQLWSHPRIISTGGKQPAQYLYDEGSVRYWPSRDPIEESGGINLYGMVGNDAVGSWDYLGKYNLQPDSGNGPNDNQLKKIKESMERIVKKIEKLEKKMDKIIGCFCKEALSPTTDWTKYRSHPGIGSVLSRLYKTKWVLERVKKGIKGNENLEVELVPLDGGVGGQASTWPGNILDPVMRLQTSGERNWENLSDDGLDEVIFHELTHVAANTVDKSPDGWMGTDPNNAHSLDDIINEDDLCTYFLFYFSLEMIQKSECCKNKVIE